jgi:5'(3')-deoxyribonucleotidase
MMKDRDVQPVALMDLDGTLCDYDAALARDMESIRSPKEPKFDIRHHDEQPDYIKTRMDLIRSNPHWWENLALIPSGFKVYTMLKDFGFRIVVLTQGPRLNAEAWKGKLLWCRKYLAPDTDVIITRDKGLVYGKILVDDFPPYIEGWIKHRPRGFVVMPDQPWNQDFKHKQVVRYTGKDVLEHAKLIERIRRVLKDFQGDAKEQV